MTHGRGFRWVRVGEMIRKGDQYLEHSGDWEETLFYGLWKCEWEHYYRRRTATRKKKGRA